MSAKPTQTHWARGRPPQPPFNLKGVYLMSKSITFHHGTTISRGHNLRNANSIKNQKHIDKDRIKDNLIFVDKDIKEVYKELFSESVAEYNAKQKRSDRKIDDYYEKIKEDKKKNVCYECIVQIGSESDTSYSSELEKQALIKYVQDWEERNPNLKLIGAYMHNDEATSHFHIDYIPVAYNCKRGMKTQSSLAGALKEQGFVSTKISDTEQMKWQNSERLALEKICLEMGIDVKANQGLYKTKYFDEKTQTVKIGHRRHLSTMEYKQAKKEMLSDITEEKKQLEKEVATLNNEIKRKTSVLNQEVEVPTMPKVVTVKNVFGKEKTRNLTEEERKIKQQEIDNIKKHNELVQQQALLMERELIIHEQEERQKEKFKQQSVELEKIENAKNTLQKEIANLEHKKAQIIEDTEKIVKDKVNNALDNLSELQAYYTQSDAYKKVYRENFAKTEKANNQRGIQGGNKNENKDAEYINNHEL